MFYYQQSTWLTGYSVLLRQVWPLCQGSRVYYPLSPFRKNPDFKIFINYPTLCNLIHDVHILRWNTGSVQFTSVLQSCSTLCDPMNCSTPGLPVHHQHPEFTQTHVHRVSDAIQPPHPSCPLLLLPSIPPSIRVFFNESTLRMRWPK